MGHECLGMCWLIYYVEGKYMSEQHFDTIKVRGGYNSADHNYAVNVPIYQSAAFDLGSVERGLRLFSYDEVGSIYTRVGNPTTDVLEQRIAALDKATGAVALASGMAAISNTIFALTAGGGRILASPRLYGGSFDSFTQVYPDFGIEIDFVSDADDPAAYAAAIRPDTKAIFVETISNPNAIVADIEALAEVAHTYGIPLVVDNTFATPYLFRPFEHGADIVIYSATKQLNGHGNVIAGIILENGKFDWSNGKFPSFEKKLYTLRDRNDENRSILEAFPEFPFTARIRSTYLNYLGAALGPFDAYLALIGLETLSERVAKQVSNAEKLVKYLETRREVVWVSHPSAQKSVSRCLAAKYLPNGGGSVLTFGFNGTDEKIAKFLNAVKIFSFHANVGDSRSLIINSPQTTHGELTQKELNLAGILPETIRISAGLEDIDDLTEDLTQAFAIAFA